MHGQRGLLMMGLRVFFSESPQPLAAAPTGGLSGPRSCWSRRGYGSRRPTAGPAGSAGSTREDPRRRDKWCPRGDPHGYVPTPAGLKPRVIVQGRQLFFPKFRDGLPCPSVAPETCRFPRVRRLDTGYTLSDNPGYPPTTIRGEPCLSRASLGIMSMDRGLQELA